MPAGQSAQAARDGDDVDVVDVEEALGAPAYLPAGQTVQSASESCAAAAVALSARKRPAGHGVHVEFSSRAMVSEYMRDRRQGRRRWSRQCSWCRSGAGARGAPGLQRPMEVFVADGGGAGGARVGDARRIGAAERVAGVTETW